MSTTWSVSCPSQGGFIYGVLGVSEVVCGINTCFISILQLNCHISHWYDAQ